MKISEFLKISKLVLSGNSHPVGNLLNIFKLNNFTCMIEGGHWWNNKDFNPVWYDPSVMNIRYGGGQKHLRYIIQIYISQFKSDYSGVKSKSEVHIIRSHLEKKNCKNFQKWMSYRCFCLSFENSKKIWEKKFWDSKSFLLGQFSKYWGLVFCKHPQFVSIKGF